MSLAIISHPDCLLHEMGPYHPEQPARILAIEEEIRRQGLDQVTQAHLAPLAPRAALERVHNKDYIDQIFKLSPSQGHIQIDSDTAMNPYTLNAALRSAGAVLLAVDLVMQHEANQAFCNIRPPGHHAEHDQAMGFCFFNNVAVGVAYALEQYHLNRIAIVDFDVHHGNGSEDIFKNEKRVLLCSSFQHPFYPNTEAESRPAHLIPIPLAAGSDGLAFREAVTQQWLGPLEVFQPELIFFSAGFDAYIDDEMANLNLVEEDYAWITTEVKRIAEESAKGRIISVLEGGYELKGLGRSVAAHLEALRA